MNVRTRRGGESSPVQAETESDEEAITSGGGPDTPIEPERLPLFRTETNYTSGSRNMRERLRALGLPTQHHAARDRQLRAWARAPGSFHIHRRDGARFYVKPSIDAIELLLAAFWRLDTEWCETFGNQLVRASSWPLHLVWDIYTGAAHRVGIPLEDVAVQFEAEWGVPGALMPTPAVALTGPDRADVDTTTGSAGRGYRRQMIRDLRAMGFAGPIPLPRGDLIGLVEGLVIYD
ncbi:hypothetical protein GQ53DRAFT_849828 [Thozetella sp. PMI_491]|nr:hypothetical protein GQ53DRAFT_849828 [Thozetella sp. PMI_491]